MTTTLEPCTLPLKLFELNSASAVFHSVSEDFGGPYLNTFPHPLFLSSKRTCDAFGVVGNCLPLGDTSVRLPVIPQTKKTCEPDLIGRDVYEYRVQ